MAMAAAAQPTPEGLARLEELREEAYTKVLRAFTQQTFHWVSSCYKRCHTAMAFPAVAPQTFRC